MTKNTSYYPLTTGAIEATSTSWNGATYSLSEISSNNAELKNELKEIREMLMMLNRDHTLEKKYPKLKETADEYHRQLEKYRTFERLKGEE